MRVSTQTVLVNRPTQISASREEISHYIVTSNSVSVHVKYYDDNNNELSNENYDIVGERYEMLMSESPPFAPGKPANEFRREDLWYFVDLQRK